MCRAIRCRTCGKTSWAGCGMHIGAVRASVPASQWCDGHEAQERPTTWLQRLLGR